MRKKNEETKQGFKEVLVKNAWPIFTSVGGAILFIYGFVLSLRADVNTVQLQINALQQSSSTIQSLVAEVAAIKVTGEETKEKVDAIYKYLLK